MITTVKCVIARAFDLSEIINNIIDRVHCPTIELGFIFFWIIRLHKIHIYRGKISSGRFVT